MKAPFPYFGAKSSIAALVWEHLGNVEHYLEPFFGSGAVLLARPCYSPKENTETVNDADGLLCNVWRALQNRPDEVAKHCDWPVNHIDLCSRKRVLISEKDGLTEKLVADDNFFDAKLAGYWLWCASCWIGSGLTSPNQRPRLGHKGEGVHKIYNDGIYEWFRRLSERLRYVRVVCGDWTRICGGNWQGGEGANWSTCGIFLDPPYSHDCGRDEALYDKESADVAKDVEKWAFERGKNPAYRIVLAGYEGEHNQLETCGWRKIEWKTTGGYGNIAGNNRTRGQENRHRERLWVSPHCLKPGLF